MGSILKNLLFAVVLVALLYFGYKTFFGAGSADLMVEGGASEGQLVASEFLIKLNELQSIDFSSDLFSDRRFNSFVSFSTLPDPVLAGRENPFSF